MLNHTKHLWFTEKMKQRVRPGFTIVELLIVIVAIGILAALVIVAYNGVQAKASNAVLQADLRNAAIKLSEAETETGTYPSSDSGFAASNGTTFQYVLRENGYCLTASSDASGTESFHVTNSGQVQSGPCTEHSGPLPDPLPEGYESAPVAVDASTDIGGYSPIQPESCPEQGGQWIKVPGNSLYGETNGFCVQKYPANNVSSVATSQPSGPRWTALTQAAAKTVAEAVDTGTHLFSEPEWMTIAANAAMQPANWSGGSVGAGTLPRGSGTASYGGVSVTLSNGETIHFDTGSSSNRASNEWTCYTGNNASSCGLAGQHHPIPANAYFTDQFGFFSSYGSFQTSGDYYYGDPRFANPSLGAYVTSARDKGLGYLRSTYGVGSSSVYGFNRGSWTGATSSGLFTLYIYTLQGSYAHATYGFRAAK